MSQLKSLTVLALASAGLLAAGCGSSSSSSSGTAAASAPATASPAAAGKPSAADCKIIAPISASAVAKLTPLSTESKAKAATGMKAYISSLAAAKTKLTSAGGKKVIGDFITALEKSGKESTSQGTTTMIAALGSLGKACS